jgi:hypothetical protein
MRSDSKGGSESEDDETVRDLEDMTFRIGLASVRQDFSLRVGAY